MMSAAAARGQLPVVVDFSAPNASGNANGWTATAGGAVNAVPFVFDENQPGNGWNANVISVTSNGLSTGTFLSGGSLSNFYGFWTANYSFFMPYGSTNISLNYSGLFADDRVVLELNGKPINAVGIKAPGVGYMVFSNGGSSVSYSFSQLNSSGAVSNGFIFGGQNNLTAIVNNTFDGIFGGLTSITNSGDHTGFAVTGTLSYYLNLFITGLNLAGSNLVINAANGSAGGTYTVLTSTNLALPLSQWTPAASNLTAGNSNFTIVATNAVSPGAPEQFFMIQGPLY